MGILDPKPPTRAELTATYVRFQDTSGNPLPPGSLVTITVDVTTVPKRIADIVVEEI